MLENELQKAIKKYELQKYVTEKTDAYYDHITFSVESLRDFVELVGALSLALVKNSYKTLLYRGMSDIKWRLLPSILRFKSKNSKSYTVEHDLAMNFLSEQPKLFENSNSHFENLSKMQHFGIPTRLLDFTENPLISLYFACSEHSGQAGRVVFTANKLHFYNEPIVESIASSYLSENLYNMSLDKWISRYGLSADDYLFDIYTEYNEASPLFVKPIYLDRRMEAQRSVFLLFHNYLRDLLADYIYYGYGQCTKSHPDLTLERVKEVYREQVENPAVIYGSRHFLVTRESFENLTSFYRKYNLDDFLQNTKDALSTRFLLTDMIEGLEMDDIWYNFSSIIIPANKKRAILYELQNIGIDTAFVYPESEYVADRIKNFYH